MTGPRGNHLGWSVAVLALAVGGCGGGGARPQPTPVPPVVTTPPLPTPTPTPAPTPTPPPVPTPPPPPVTNYDDAEYRRSNGAVAANAISAYNTGATGSGITIAVVDSGINPNLADFAGKIAPGSGDVVAQRGISDTEGHGTAVSAVAAAGRNGQNTLGVAFDSLILSLNTSNPSDCSEEDGCKHSSAAIATAIDRARTNGARVINISLGGDGVSQQVLQAVQRAAAAGLVIVLSAGNDGAASPDSFATSIAGAASANVIIAGSVGVGDQGVDLSQISTFSNRAGTASANYLTALGFRVRAPDHTGAQFLWSGTSFSAPVISGAAALLASAFPNLTGAQIVSILMNSADDLGEAGTDATFGRGRVNLTRAFQPQGAIRVAGSSALPVTGSLGGTTSGPMGDAAQDLPGVVILDGFDRAYALDLARTLDRTAAERPLGEALQPGMSTGQAAVGATSVSITVSRSLAGRSQLEIAESGLSNEEAQRARVVAGAALTRLSPRTAVAFGFSETGQALQQRLNRSGGGAFLVARDPAGRTGFIAGDAGSIGVRHELGIAGVTVTAEQGEVRQPGLTPAFERPGYTSAAITADRRFGPVQARIGVTRLDEAETVLGGRFGFAPAGSSTTFVDLGLSYDISRLWGAGARLRNGWTQLPGGNGLVQGGSLASDAWSLDLWRRSAFADGDLLSLRVTQPLRVRAGGYTLNLPVSYDYADGSVGYRSALFNLAPTGHEIAVEAAYAMPLFQGAGNLTANAFMRRDPGHIRAASDDVGAAVRFTLGF